MTVHPSSGAVSFSGPVTANSGIKSSGTLAQLAFANRDNAAKSSLWYSNSSGAHLWVDDVGDKLNVSPAGNVAIGTADTTKAKLAVVGYASGKPENDAVFVAYTSAGEGPVVAATPQAVSLYTDQVIWTGEFLIASSDERIKVIAGISDKTADLKTLRDIDITDYHYRDTNAKGIVPQKKVIAQQVEKVFPQAVRKQTDVIPDIYKPASCKDGWVELDTDLKKGERVKLIPEKSGEKIEEVLEVAPGKFRTAYQSAGEKVFVYGRQVDDFRTVDYDAIAMLNVSATQELARKLEAEHAAVLVLQKENAALRATLEQQLAAQAAKDKSRDEQLAAIVSLLEARSTSTVTTAASVK